MAKGEFATYNYIFTDLLSGKKVDVLPMYGVSMSDIMSKNGDFTGTIRMDNPKTSPDDILDATIPGARGVWVERDDTAVWAGIIWSRTYQSNGRSLQLTAQTFTSYPAAVVNTVDATLIEEPQNHIIDIWATIPTLGAEYNIGVQVPAHMAERGRTVQQTYAAKDQYNFQRYIDTMVGKDAEYRIRVFKDQFGNRTALLEVGFYDVNFPIDRLGTPSSNDNIVFQYPGDISEYYVTENAAKGATKGYATGDASGDNAIYSTYANPGKPANSIGIDFQSSYTFATQQAVLDAQLQHDVKALTPPVASFTCHLAGEKVNMSEWTLGDYGLFIADDPFRFPGGVAKGNFRIVGWELHPPEGSGVEELYLTVQNPDALLPSADVGSTS